MGKNRKCSSFTSTGANLLHALYVHSHRLLGRLRGHGVLGGVLPDRHVEERGAGVGLQRAQGHRGGEAAVADTRRAWVLQVCTSGALQTQCDVVLVLAD